MKRFVVLIRSAALAFALAGSSSVAFSQVPVSIAAEEAAATMNGLRASAGIAGVAADPGLTALATEQARAMAATNTMGHTVAGTLQARLAAAGYGNMAAAENVAAGQPTLESAFAAWMQSDPHRANILNRQMAMFGLGAATASGVTYWALILTAPAR